ncbi:hypothetical protein BM1_08156 [Bipolaris maydis]|nr:hypothetical protein BM1_08156 [Bipolaris maydis]
MASTSVPKHLNFITGNKNKLAEVQAILSGVIELRNQNVDLVEIQGTVEEVTRDKARRAAEAVKGPVLVEDTCLCFPAMNDLPGPYMYVFLPFFNPHPFLPCYRSKWFMLSLGPLNLHKLLAGFDDKSAQAVCTFGYCEGPGHEAILFQGRTDGKLVESRGSTVFGWDSCFEYEGKTYAEMDKSEKNKISHRGKALEKLKEWLAKSHNRYNGIVQPSPHHFFFTPSLLLLLLLRLLLPHIIPPPLLHPPLTPLQIRLYILGTLTPQLDHNLLSIRVAGLLEQNLHNLTIHILLELLARVAARSEAVVQDGRVAPQHDDKIDPALGEEVAGVPVEDVAAGRVQGQRFEVVEELQ